MDFLKKIIEQNKLLTILLMFILIVGSFFSYKYVNSLNFNEEKVDFDLSSRYIKSYIKNNGVIEDNIKQEILLNKINKKDSLLKNILIIIKEKEKTNEVNAFLILMDGFFVNTTSTIDTKIKMFVTQDSNDKFNLTSDDIFKEEYYYLKNKIEVLKYLKLTDILKYENKQESLG